MDRLAKIKLGDYLPMFATDMTLVREKKTNYDHLYEVFEDAQNSFFNAV